MVAKFWYVIILFPSNKLLKLKYIHHYFFLKFLTKKSRCVLWAGVFYGPGNTVHIYRHIYIIHTYIYRGIYTYIHTYIQGVPLRKVSILGGHNIGHSKQELYLYMCPIPNVFRDRAMSMYRIWRPILSFPPAALRHCMKHVNRYEASVGPCDCLF